MIYTGKKMKPSIFYIYLHLVSVAIYLAIVFTISFFVFPIINSNIIYSTILFVILLALCDYANHKYSMSIIRFIRDIITSFITLYIMFSFLNYTALTSVSIAFIEIVIILPIIVLPTEVLFKRLRVR